MDKLVTPLRVINYAKGWLETWQGFFVENPSATNWEELERSMRVYQYIHWLFERGGVAEQYQLVDALTDVGSEKWDDLILEMSETA